MVISLSFDKIVWDTKGSFITDESQVEKLIPKYLVSTSVGLLSC
jgi:hypothetical protein